MPKRAPVAARSARRDRGDVRRDEAMDIDALVRRRAAFGGASTWS
jgi:hypothetical protein